MSIRDYPLLKSGVTPRLPGDFAKQDCDFRLDSLLLPPGFVREYRFDNECPKCRAMMDHLTRATWGCSQPGCDYVQHVKPRGWKYDYAWSAVKVALEIEGGAWTQGRHTRGRGFINDTEKYNSGATRGWYIIRCIPQQLESGEAGTLVALAIQTKMRESAKDAT